MSQHFNLENVIAICVPVSTGPSNPVLSAEPKTAYITLDHGTIYISVDSGLMSGGYDGHSKRVLSDLGCRHFTQGPALALLESVDRLCSDCHG